MDALSEVLRATRLSGGVFLRARFTEPWCIASTVTAADCSQLLGPTDHLILYHYVLEGALSVDVIGGPSVTVHPHQAVIFPRNNKHHMRGEKVVQARSAMDVAQIPKPGDLMVIDHGGGGPVTRIICGYLGGPALAGDPLLTSLPPLLVFDGKTARSGTMVKEMLRYAADEIAAGRQGSDAMIARLSELLFIEAVRTHVEALPAEAAGWLAALRNPGLARSIGLLHAQPGRSWTTTELGREAGISRSSLCDRFATLLDCTPSEYLNTLRMRLAARDLEASNEPIISVALKVGYGSEAAFSRAFKRHHGVPPSQWRRRMHEKQTD